MSAASGRPGERTAPACDGGGSAGRAAPAGAGDGLAECAEASSPPLYLVLTYVPRRTVVVIGEKGPQVFPRGWYIYVGSAVRAREARVARHLAREKPLRWHADYLFTAAPARAAWLVDGAAGECELAGSLAGLPGAERRPPRFGAGDCRCAGHLVSFSRRPLRRDLAAAAGLDARVTRFRRDLRS